MAVHLQAKMRYTGDRYNTTVILAEFYCLSCIGWNLHMHNIVINSKIKNFLIRVTCQPQWQVYYVAWRCKMTSGNSKNAPDIQKQFAKYPEKICKEKKKNKLT